MTVVRKIVIVGAGAAGLCAHLALRRAGFEVEHYERKPAFGAEGGNFALWPNGVKVLTALGIGDRLDEIGFPARHFTTYDLSGELVSRVSFEGFRELTGARMYLVTRGDLQGALDAAVGPGRIALGSVCTGIDQDADGATVRFADGTSTTADLVVCADGIRSPLRRALIDPTDSTYVGITYWTGWIDDGGFLAAHAPSADGFVEFWGVGQRAAVLPVGGGRVGYAFIARVAADHSPVDRLARLRAMYAGWPPTIAALLDRLQGTRIIHWPVYDVAPLSRWSSGRVVAIGDAAHASAPTMGQGANMAIEDGYVLAECLRDATTLADALARFERRRRPRVEMIVRESRARAQRATETDPGELAAIMEQTRTTSSHAVWANLEEIIGAGPVR